MQKTASKNIIPSESYKYLKIWVAIKLLYARMDTIHSRNLKFGIYLPCMMFHKSDVAIWAHYMGKNVAKNGGHIVFLVFWWP